MLMVDGWSSIVHRFRLYYLFVCLCFEWICIDKKECFIARNYRPRRRHNILYARDSFIPSINQAINHGVEFAIDLNSSSTRTRHSCSRVDIDIKVGKTMSWHGMTAKYRKPEGPTFCAALAYRSHSKPSQKTLPVPSNEHLNTPIKAASEQKVSKKES
jgi:hypothetical protein